VEEWHDEEGAVCRSEGVGRGDVRHCACEVAVGERHGFGPSSCAACVEDEGDVVGFGSFERGGLDVGELAFFLDFEDDCAMMWVPVAFCDCGFVFASCADGGGVLSVGVARDESEAGGEIANVEFELGLFVCWI